GGDSIDTRRSFLTVLVQPAKFRPEAVNNGGTLRRRRAEDWIYAEISTCSGGLRASYGPHPVPAAERRERITKPRRPLRGQQPRLADGREEHVDVRVRLEVPRDDLPMDGWPEPLFSQRGRLLRL